jgi:hypothetical protein
MKEFETLPRGKKRGFCDAVYIGKEIGHARFVRQRWPKEHLTHAGQLVGVSQVGVGIGVKSIGHSAETYLFAQDCGLCWKGMGIFLAFPPNEHVTPTQKSSPRGFKQCQLRARISQVSGARKLSCSNIEREYFCNQQ